MKDTNEYKLVSAFYGNDRAERSSQLLIKHIDEGLEILDSISASDDAKKAFCLHPLVQDSDNLYKNAGLFVGSDSYVILLAMEYRNIANQYLSYREIDNIDEITLSTLYEVNDMLIADKVQNYADFLIYHRETHPRSDELDLYFNNWIRKLNAQEIFQRFCI